MYPMVKTKKRKKTACKNTRSTIMFIYCNIDNQETQHLLHPHFPKVRNQNRVQAKEQLGIQI
ncbi:hypothetical protein BpHYR1_008528 [Brachionus plicatilis]|uniref:Uncharacterized protein n=1 Tax=Brachionus plicatilis TaxID=10195 RepID=A0A3M7T4Y2_BRAPC|nr:hypothetical protein BpHYR1_008528 [Brachionus plicatilis]